MDGLLNLWALQELEKEKTGWETRLPKLPQVGELRTLKKKIEEAQVEQEEMDNALKQDKKSMSQLEMDIEELKDKQKETSDLLYGGTLTNIKEMEAAGEKLEISKTKITEKEDRLLTLMTQYEAGEERKKEKKIILSNLKLKFRQLHAEYKQSQAEIKDRIDFLEHKKAEILNSIDPTLLSVYNELYRKFGPTVVGKVEKNICTGCHMAISLELRKALKNTNETLKCDKCGRLLIYSN